MEAIPRRTNKMPNKDKTGPEGKGSKTGRQMGNCQGAEPVREAGRGQGQGRGMGRGFRRANADTQEKTE